MTTTTSAAAVAMERDGFVLFDDVVPDDLMPLLSAGCDELIEQSMGMTTSSYEFQLEADGEGGGWAARASGGAGLPGKLRVVGRAHEHSPKIAEAERLLRLPERFVTPVYGRSGPLYDVFLWAKPGVVGSRKPWHQDNLFVPDGFFDGNVDVYTIWVAVDDAHEGNGCLRFLPGSHRGRRIEQPDGMAEELFDSPVEPCLDIARLWPDLTPVTVPRKPGSGVMFSGFTAHTSARNDTGTDRRAVSFVYTLPR